MLDRLNEKIVAKNFKVVVMDLAKRRKLMEQALAEIVVPVLRQKGFVGSLPYFRRVRGKELDLLAFQFDKYGGGFVIEIAKTRNEPFRTSWGSLIIPKKIKTWDVPNRRRISPRGFLKPGHWRRYEGLSFFENIYEWLAFCFVGADRDWFRFDKVITFRDYYGGIAYKVLGLLESCAEQFYNHSEERLNSMPL